MTELYRQCPKFDLCSATKCPLDSQLHLRGPKLPSDESCKLSKNKRLRLFEKFPTFDLPYKGLTSREFAAKRFSFTEANP